jgi:hypothetical protein
MSILYISVKSSCCSRLFSKDSESVIEGLRIKYIGKPIYGNMIEISKAIKIEIGSLVLFDMSRTIQTIEANQMSKK